MRKILAAVFVLGLTSLSFFLPSVYSQTQEPNLTVVYLATNNSDDKDGWIKNVKGSDGDILQFYLEVHNTKIDTEAQNLKVRASLPSQTFTKDQSRVDVTAANALGAFDTLNIEIKESQGGKLEYVNGSTKVTWDKNGDGAFEYHDRIVEDTIISEGLNLGILRGCNQYIIQISFRAKIVDSQSSPTPTPTTQPSPTPTSAPKVAGTATQSAQTKELPKTGISSLFLSSFFGGISGGLFLKNLSWRFRDRAKGMDGSLKESWLWLKFSQEKKRKKDGSFDRDEFKI